MIGSQEELPEEKHRPDWRMEASSTSRAIVAGTLIVSCDASALLLSPRSATPLGKNSTEQLLRSFIMDVEFVIPCDGKQFGRKVWCHERGTYQVGEVVGTSAFFFYKDKSCDAGSQLYIKCKEYFT